MKAFDTYIGSGKVLNGSNCVAVAGADHVETLKCIREMRESWNSSVLLFGNAERIRTLSDSLGLELESGSIIDVSDEQSACLLSAAAAARGDANVLMKGGVHTSVFSRALLDKENGLLVEGAVMSHLGMFELPFYHKPLFITDSAIVIEPDLETKITIANQSCGVLRSLGIEHPKVALLAPVEQINRKITSTLDAAAFTVRQKEAGACPYAEVEGPFAMDVILSRQAAEIKGISSSVAGDADLIIFPNLDTGNAVFKIFTVVPGARGAGMLTGLKVPVVVTSRSDNERTRFNSLGLALSSAGSSD